jgi:hypothetical protein
VANNKTTEGEIEIERRAVNRSNVTAAIFIIVISHDRVVFMAKFRVCWISLHAEVIKKSIPFIADTNVALQF